jgi:hypothetical protein
MTERGIDSGSRSFADVDGGSGWPETPDQLVYHLDAVLELFNRAQSGERIDLLEGLLDCVNWREMFGSTGSGFLRPEQVDELMRYYRAKFAGLERFYLAEQLSTELMTALMASGEITFSDELKRLGRERPRLWQEIRAFFSRKELATSLILAADRERSGGG